MPQVGAGKYTYELIRDFLKLPAGETFGLVSRVAADAQDRIYVFQRKDPPVVVFDRDGKYLGAWALARSPIRTVSKLSAIPSTRPIAPTRSQNHLHSTADLCSSLASAVCIPTPAKSPTGGRSAQRDRSITRPK